MRNECYLRALTPPEGVFDAVLDTDAYNEIDDQFAIAYMLRSTDRIRTRAIYAAPFLNERAASAADGMEKSYGEILHLLSLMGETELSGAVYRGSPNYLPDEKTPIPSPAASHLAELAMQYSEENPLYVIAIGAITNVASALLLKPEIKDRTVIVWLGGHGLHWRDTNEFNMKQDVAAARVVLGSGAPVVLFPCMGVVSAFTVSGDDMRARLYGKNPLCTYLVENAESEVARYVPKGEPFSRVIWDVTAVSWLTARQGGRDRFFTYRLIPAPICEYDHTYSTDPDRHSIAYVDHICRDELLHDLIRRIAK